jgi:hypothetical protein
MRHLQTFVRVSLVNKTIMFEYRLDFSIIRRYVRNKASYPALPAECRIREPREEDDRTAREKMMSTASVHTSAHPSARPSLHPSAPLPRLRLTRRGRAVFTFLAAIPVVVAAAVFALNGGGAVATSNTAPVPLHIVTVQAGETLWSLAEEFAPSADPRDFITNVMAINGDAASMLQAGSQLAIPVEYTQP